jgi:hypothetical protein
VGEVHSSRIQAAAGSRAGSVSLHTRGNARAGKAKICVSFGAVQVGAQQSPDVNRPRQRSVGSGWVANGCEVLKAFTTKHHGADASALGHVVAPAGNSLHLPVVQSSTRRRQTQLLRMTHSRATTVSSLYSGSEVFYRGFCILGTTAATKMAAHRQFAHHGLGLLLCLASVLLLAHVQLSTGYTDPDQCA